MTFSTFGLNALTFFPIHGDKFLPKPAQELVVSNKLPNVLYQCHKLAIIPLDSNDSYGSVNNQESRTLSELVLIR